MGSLVPAVVVATAVLCGCTAGAGEPQVRATPASDRVPPSADAATTTPLPSASGTATPSASATTRAPAREPRRSYLHIPAIGVRQVPVVRYRGTTDDRPGTRIQNRGPAASPRGPRGGVGPGEVGNFLVTGHRTSHAAPFRRLPEVRRGDRVRVRSGPTVYVYEVTETRRVSFRSARSLAKQRAAVPGRPGVAPTEAMITLSTCATPEDHAAGNFWFDELGNPEHRIDKVGVLVATRPA